MELIKLLNEVREKYVAIQQQNSRLDFISDEFVDWLDDKIGQFYLDIKENI